MAIPGTEKWSGKAVDQIWVDEARSIDSTAYLYAAYKQHLDHEIAKAFYSPVGFWMSRDEEKLWNHGSKYGMGPKKFADHISYFPKKEKAMEFTIVKMDSGGYVVRRFSASVFASTTIEEALKFIKGQMEPKEKKNADH